MPIDIFTGTSMPDYEWWEALFPDPITMMRAPGLTPEMTVLDLCCGNGHFTAALATVANGRVYALDLAPR